MNRILQCVGGCALVVVGLASQLAGGQTPTATDTLHPVASTPWNAVQAGWAGRMVVLEHNTGSFCEGCQFADEAINALIQRYPASAFISLGYHLGYDWLLRDPIDSETIDRVDRWYGYVSLRKKDGMKNVEKDDRLGQVDSGEPDTLIRDFMVDGRGVLPPIIYSGGSGSEYLYDKEVAAIDAELRRAPEAFFHVRATVRGGRVLARVKVDSIKGRHPKLYLRLLLVEDTVTLHPHFERHRQSSPENYRNLLREQHGVVYGIAYTPTLAMGLPLPGPGTQRYTFDVAALQRRILQVYQKDTLQVSEWYRDMFENIRNDIYPEERDWRLNPKHLRVVAFIQDARSGEVLQTAMVPVDGKRLVLP